MTFAVSKSFNTSEVISTTKFLDFNGFNFSLLVYNKSTSINA